MDQPLSSAAPCDFSSALENAKLESLVEFAAGAGHEINNPLAAIVGRAQLLLKQETNPDRRKSIVAIIAQAMRITDMIGDLMLFARPPQPRLASTDLGAIVTELVNRFQAELHDRKITCTVQRSPDSLLITADPTQTAVVVSELLRNAMHAATPNGWIDLTLEPIVGRPEIDAADSHPPHDLPPIEARSYLGLTIDNSGPPLTAAEQAHLFDPFFSGRDAGRGLGFGLCKVWRILQLHRGWVTFNSNTNETSFTVAWPR